MLCQKCESKLCAVVELEKTVNEAKSAAMGHKGALNEGSLLDAWYEAERSFASARIACTKRYNAKRNTGKKNV